MAYPPHACAVAPCSKKAGIAPLCFVLAAVDQQKRVAHWAVPKLFTPPRLAAPARPGPTCPPSQRLGCHAIFCANIQLHRHG